MASRAYHTELASWLCLTLLCAFPCLCDSLRYINAQAIPKQDSYLDTLPMHEQFASSPLKCLELCLKEVKCMSINYFEDKTCQLLKNYVCDGLKSLVSKSGAKHFDVDWGRTTQELDYYAKKANYCTPSLNRCSPKCKDCTLGSTFVNTATGVLVGNNIAIFYTDSVPQCEQECKLESQCRAFEYSGYFCFLSALTRDMMNPDAFEYKSDYHYSERICT